MTEAGPTEVSVTDPDELPIVGGGGGRAPICLLSSRGLCRGVGGRGRWLVGWLVSAWLVVLRRARVMM